MLYKLQRYTYLKRSFCLIIIAVLDGAEVFGMAT